MNLKFLWLGMVLALCARAGSPASYAIRFDRQLGIGSPLRLAGRHSARSVAFDCEASSRPLPGSELRLVLAHAADVDPDRSFLSITLNYGVLRSIRLDGDSAGPAAIDIPIPPDLLKPENRLVFSVEQWPRAGAGAGAVWTEIGAASEIVVPYQPAAFVRDLSLLPAPLLDRYSYRPQTLEVLAPARSATQGMEAAALLVANFVARVAPLPVRVRLVRSLAEAQAGVIAIGTPGSPRIIANPEHAELPVLVAGGAEAVRLAAGSAPPDPPRSWRGYLPPGGHFTLQELGWRTAPLDAENGYRLTVPLDATPDARFLPYGEQMTLWFQADRNAAPPRGRLSVEWNGHLLGSLDAATITRGAAISLRLAIPASWLTARNALRLRLAGVPRDPDQQPAVLLLPNSQFYLPREFHADLPDLALLGSGFYPFSVQPDLSDTIVLLPDSPDPALFDALVKLAAGLGARVPARRLAFRVRRLSELTGSERAASNFLFLHGGSPYLPGPPQVFPNWPALPWTRAVLGQPVVREIVSPWNRRKFVLAIGADALADLPAAVARLFDPAVLAGLQGDTAFLASPRPVCFATTTRRTFGETAYLARLEAWLRANWIALPLILLAASAALFLALRQLLDGYKSRGRDGRVARGMTVG